jgi:large subunit ribosomal protein L10
VESARERDARLQGTRLVRVSSFRKEIAVQRTDKEQIVADLAEQLGSTDTLIVADYRGLTNKQLESLRDELLQHGARFRIVKNTLTRRAAEKAGADGLLVMLEGPTAIAFIESGGDSAAVAKALSTTARETNVLALRGGILEGKTVSGEELETLAKLPSAEVLRSQLVGAIVAPVTQLLALVSTPLRDLHGLVEARIRQLEEQGEVVSAADAAEPEAEAVAEAAPAAAEDGDEAAETDDVPEAPAAAEGEQEAAQEEPGAENQTEEESEEEKADGD